MLLRPESGAAQRDDHIEVLELALAQLPVAPLGLDPEAASPMLVRADTPGYAQVRRRSGRTGHRVLHRF